MQTFEERFQSIPRGETKTVFRSFRGDVSDCCKESDYQDTKYSETIMEDWLKAAFAAGRSENI